MVCGKCGATVQAGTKTCPKCGKPIRFKRPKPSDYEQKKKMSLTERLKSHDMLFYVSHIVAAILLIVLPFLYCSTVFNATGRSPADWDMEALQEYETDENKANKLSDDAKAQLKNIIAAVEAGEHEGKWVHGQESSDDQIHNQLRSFIKAVDADMSDQLEDALQYHDLTHAQSYVHVLGKTEWKSLGQSLTKNPLHIAVTVLSILAAVVCLLPMVLPSMESGKAMLFPNLVAGFHLVWMILSHIILKSNASSLSFGGFTIHITALGWVFIALCLITIVLLVIDKKKDRSPKPV